MTDGTRRTLKIVNEKGLHARASARLVEVVEDHEAACEVSKDGLSASGDSIMGLLMLAASSPQTFHPTNRSRVNRFVIHESIKLIGQLFGGLVSLFR